MPETSRNFARTAKFASTCLFFFACQTLAQVLDAPQALPASAPLSSPTAATAPVNPGTSVRSKRWHSLNLKQKQALAPLSEQWDGLTAQQRIKWLTVADTFLQLTDEEQMTMHGRMREWAGLSAKERNAARFNFNSTLTLSIEDKRAQWKAYQSLPDSEKQQLSSGPKPPAKSAARTTLPANNRLMSPPVLPVNTPKAIPRVAPSQPVNPKTLLPKQARA